MSEAFLRIVNMSISAGWLVLAVLALRLILRKAPKWVNVLLWGIVAVRLLCPISIESALSLIPSPQTISPEIMMDHTPEITTGIPALNSAINPIISDSFAPNPGDSANPLQILIPVAANIWFLGMVVLLLYTAISYISLRRKLRTATILRENVYQCVAVDSPFVLGIVRPKIYLPYQMEGQDLEHVVAHEQAHICRKDHWWKPLGFLLLTVHWFNPLMWIAYILLCRDIELACDEKVIKELGNEQRADYTEALVHCSVSRRMIAACPLAFGEVGVKERVRNVMNYRKPRFWILIIAIVVSIVVAVCFLTNPKPTTLGDQNGEFSHVFVDVEEVFITHRENYHSYRNPGDRFLEAFREIGITKEPINRNLGERDRSWQVCFDGEFLCISADCTELWLDSDVKPSYTYGVTDSAALRSLLEKLLPIDEPPEDVVLSDVLYDDMIGMYNGYVPYQCLYMTPLSSYYPQFGDSGRTYTLYTDSVYVKSRSGTVIVYDPVSWDWKKIDWNEDFFKSMLLDTIDILSPEKIQVLFGRNPEYQMLGTDEFLVRTDGRLLICHTMTHPDGSKNLWSVFELVTDTQMGRAQWIYDPASSACPGFSFTFDMEYTHITARTDRGMLISYDKPAYIFHDPGETIEVNAGHSLYWCPGEIEDRTPSYIDFAVWKGSEALCGGTLRISYGGQTELGRYNYSATIVGYGMGLEQDVAQMGGLISYKN